MNCRHCRHSRTKCYRTVHATDLTTRYILCEKCGKNDTTYESFTISTYAGQSVSSEYKSTENTNTDTDPKAYVHIATTPRQRTVQPEHPGFDEAWKLYLKKECKAAARKAWNKLCPPLELVIKALRWQFARQDWLKEGHRFAPNFSTYLHDGRWEDEPPAGVRASSNQQGSDPPKPTQYFKAPPKDFRA